MCVLVSEKVPPSMFVPKSVSSCLHVFNFSLTRSLDDWSIHLSVCWSNATIHCEITTIGWIAIRLNAQAIVHTR